MSTQLEIWLMKSLYFFEEVFEGLAGVCGARWGWRRRCCGGRLGVRRGGGVFFDGHAEFVEGAIVFGVLGSDALGNGLRAFELDAGIEEAALLAGVKFELAFRACAVGVEAGGQDCSAICAAAASDGADHSGGAWAELVGAARAAGRRFTAIMIIFRFLVVFFRVAITAVAVLSIHERLRPSFRRTTANANLLLALFAHNNLARIHSDCYTRPACAIVPKGCDAECLGPGSRRWVLYVFSPLGVRSQVRL